MLVPTMRSTGTCISSSTRSTPMWARPRAPPPDRTTPILGRGAAQTVCATASRQTRKRRFIAGRTIAASNDNDGINPLPLLRIGEGWDTHQLVTGRPLILGGVTIPHTHGLLGHSDADALAHAITDALLGAAALGDIG